MQEQLFKLYHNESEIERLSEELRGKQKDLDKLVSTVINDRGRSNTVRMAV